MDGWEYSTQMYLLIELDYSYKAINKNKIKNFRRFGLKQKKTKENKRKQKKTKENKRKQKKTKENKRKQKKTKKENKRKQKRKKQKKTKKESKRRRRRRKQKKKTKKEKNKRYFLIDYCVLYCCTGLKYELNYNKIITIK